MLVLPEPVMPWSNIVLDLEELISEIAWSWALLRGSFVLQNSSF